LVGDRAEAAEAAAAPSEVVFKCVPFLGGLPTLLQALLLLLLLLPAAAEPEEGGTADDDAPPEPMAPLAEPFLCASCPLPSLTSCVTLGGE